MIPTPEPASNALDKLEAPVRARDAPTPKPELPPIKPRPAPIIPFDKKLDELILFLNPVSNPVYPSPNAKPPCWINNLVTPPILLAIVSRYLFIDNSVLYCGSAKSSSKSSDFFMDSLFASVSPKTVPVPVFAF